MHLRLQIIPIILFILAQLGSAMGLFAWGSGHDDVNRIVLDRLPVEIKALLSPYNRKAFVKDAKVPDDFTPWSEYEKNKGRVITQNDLATLSKYKIKTPYALHSAKGQAVNYVLLYRALEDRDGDRIAFWGACLAHTLADEVACNHDPLIHYLTYAFKGGYGMKFGKAGMLDFGELCQTTEGYALALETLGTGSPKSLGKESKEVLVEIMLHGLRANQFMTERSVIIASAFDPDAGEGALADSQFAMAELGAFGVRACLEVITTAWALINESKPVPVLTPEILADYKARHTKFVTARPLKADALYAQWLKLQAEIGVPAVGVVVEPSTTMNKGGLSFGGRFLASAILRELHRSKIPFRVIDAREPDRDLDTRSTSMVILCSGNFHNDELVRALKSYTNAGGHLLLIGGEHRGLLGPLSQALIKADPATLPVTSGYGQKNLDFIERIRVRFSGSLVKEIGKDALPFIHNPDTKAGWQKPKCPYRLKEDFGADIEPLAKIELDGENQIVAALYRPDGYARFLFIPEYLIAPYLLTDEPEFSNPAQPQLDRIGSKVMLTALHLLLPYYKSEKTNP
jgi:hypothetical protein